MLRLNLNNLHDPNNGAPGLPSAGARPRWSLSNTRLQRFLREVLLFGKYFCCCFFNVFFSIHFSFLVHSCGIFSDFGGQQNRLPVRQTDLPNCPDFSNCAGHAMRNALNTATLYSKQQYYTLRNLTTNQTFILRFTPTLAQTPISKSMQMPAHARVKALHWGLKIHIRNSPEPLTFNLQSRVWSLQTPNAGLWIQLKLVQEYSTQKLEQKL